MRVHIAAAMSAGAFAVVIGCAGCSAGPAHPRPSPARSSVAAPAPVALPTRSLPSPVVISATRAEQGLPGAVLGALSDPAGGAGAIEVAASPDGRYAFVTEEASQQAAVFNPHRALTEGFGPADYAGAIPL